MGAVHFFNINAAQEVGIAAAAVLHVIASRVKAHETLEENLKDGKAWMTGGQQALVDECPYITARTMRTVIKTLTDAGLIEVGKHFGRFTCFTITQKARILLGMSNAGHEDSNETILLAQT